MRRDIEKQQGNMKQLFEELKKTVSKSKEWDANLRDSFMGAESPLSFFKVWDKKLRDAGVDQEYFADFIMQEVESFKFTFSEAIKALKTEKVPELQKMNDQEIRTKTNYATADERLATKLVTIAKCLDDASEKRVSVTKLFEMHNEWQVAETNRDMAREYIHQLRVRELDKTFPGRHGWV
jgi:hypothetical protein